jgi:hypothetical protein
MNLLKGSAEILDAADMAGIKASLGSHPPNERRELVTRLMFFNDGFKHCYGVKRGSEIAYMQWIVLPSENSIIESLHRGRFLPLCQTQVLLENAYTFPRYRGLGYLPAVSASLLINARKDGFVSAITYIRDNNFTALNEFIKIGFRITRRVTEIRLLGFIRRLF